MFHFVKNIHHDSVAALLNDMNVCSFRDASALKKRLLSREKKNRSSTSIRDRLKTINFEIEDAARTLRRAKGEALAANDRLEALELRHWSLLRQYEADQQLVLEDKREEFQEADTGIDKLSIPSDEFEDEEKKDENS